MRSDSMARMPTIFTPNSQPAANTALNKWCAYSMGKCSSQPSEPTKLTRSTCTSVARPTSSVLPVSQGKLLLSSGSSMSLASRSRERGPEMTNTPREFVMLRSCTEPSVGSAFCSRSWS